MVKYNICNANFIYVKNYIFYVAETVNTFNILLFFSKNNETLLKFFLFLILYDFFKLKLQFVQVIIKPYLSFPLCSNNIITWSSVWDICLLPNKYYRRMVKTCSWHYCKWWFLYVQWCIEGLCFLLYEF